MRSVDSQMTGGTQSQLFNGFLFALLSQISLLDLLVNVHVVFTSFYIAKGQKSILHNVAVWFVMVSGRWM